MANYPSINPWDVSPATTYPVGASVSSGQYWGNNAATSTMMNQKEYVIQGQMYKARLEIANTQIQTMVVPVNPDDIKKQLCYGIAEELWKNNAIEFTKIEDPMSGKHIFQARIFAVPDTMVRILRENGK